MTSPKIYPRHCNRCYSIRVVDCPTREACCKWGKCNGTLVEVTEGMARALRRSLGYEVHD